MALNAKQARKEAAQDVDNVDQQMVARAKLDAAQKHLVAAKRMLAVQKARDSLIAFTKLMMPEPDDPNDPDLSRYYDAHHHRLIAEALERVEAGEILRLIIVMPPRHGKSQLASRMFPAWYMGRNPYNSVILTSYNDVLAQDVGRDVRNTIRSPVYGQVFPSCKLRKGSQAAERLQTTEGGMAAFIGVNGTITGRGGDLIVIDDPIKNDEEAASQLIRDKLWNWFANDVGTRFMTQMGAMVVIMTRWNEDDIVGRLTDPRNPYYVKEEAEKWVVLHLPAEAEDNDPLGRPKGAPLWPERFGAAYLRSKRLLNPRGFSALFQGRPAPEDGDFFKRAGLIPYRPEDLPRNLRYYCASDHAVGEKQQHDRNCLMVVGVDEKDVIWVLPEIYWERSDTETTVEAMIDMMDRYKPLVWWGENEHIFKSIGPFLRKRMQERQVYCTIEPVSPAKDKRVKAQAIRGRISMGMVRFPTFAPWWPNAQEEILKFPNGTHDDFVDPLGHIGRGLGRLVKAAATQPPKPKEPATGTMGWIKYASKMQQIAEKAMREGGF